MMTSEAIRPRASAVPAIVVVVLALPAYAAMLLSARALPGLDGADRGMGALAMFGAMVLLWLLLALLTLLGGARGWMPRWARFAACAFVPLSGGAAFHCLRLIGHGGAGAHWAVPALAALPLLIALYAFWAHFPVLHRVLRPTPVGVLVWVAVLAVSMAPALLEAGIAVPDPAAAPASPPVPPPAAPPAAAPASIAAAPVIAARSDTPAALMGRLATLTPDSPLADFLPFLAAGGEVKRQALERARLLDDRDRQVASLLRDGKLGALEDLWRLDLQPTPALCQAVGDKLGQEADRDRDKDGYWIVSERLEIHLETMNWLVDAGCDLHPALARIMATAESYPPSPERERFLVALAALAAAGKATSEGDPEHCVGAEDATPEQRIAGCTALIRTGRVSLRRLGSVLVSRANAFYATQRYDRAVADDGAALRIGPPDARVLTNRANAFDALGDRDGALRDYDAAIALDPKLAMAFNNRGASAVAQGEPARGLADFDAAVTLDPRYATAYANRGRANFFLGRYADAARDFGQALGIIPGDGRAALWRILARRRAGLARPADSQADAAKLDHAVWPWPLVSVYLGEHDIAWAQQAALAGDAWTQMRQACEAAFYLGEKSLLDGALTDARVLLRQAATGCPPRSIEAVAGKAELDRMPQSDSPR